MKQTIFITCAIFLGILITACSQIDASGIVAVTPLPQERPATPTPMVIVEEAEATPTATSDATDEEIGSAELLPTATPTPLSNNLPIGQAAAIAAATDVAVQPTPRNRIEFDTSRPVPIRFNEFYDGSDLRKGLLLSDKLVSLDGIDVTIEGYMAPPLKAELDYFVLTKVRLAFCPFCSTAADWPDDIALVYMMGEPATVTQAPVRVIGRMEIGQSRDEETGMVSLVRIYADEVEVLN